MNHISRPTVTIGLALVAWLYCITLGQTANVLAQSTPPHSSDSLHWAYDGEEGMDIGGC